MLKIPTRVWSQFSTILRLPGTDGLEGLQDEVVPTQDLSRIMMADRVVHGAWFRTNTPAASATSVMQWSDASDWTEIQLNGIVTVNDDELPLLTDDRIVVAVGLQLTGTQADYTSAEITRQLPFATGRRMQMAQYGAIVAGHNGPTMDPPFLLPQVLLPNEDIVELAQVVTGNAAAFQLTIQTVSAEPGVMAAFPGV